MWLVANETEEKGRDAGRVNSEAGQYDPLASAVKGRLLVKYKLLPQSFCFYWALTET